MGQVGAPGGPEGSLGGPRVPAEIRRLGPAPASASVGGRSAPAAHPAPRVGGEPGWLGPGWVGLGRPG